MSHGALPLTGAVDISLGAFDALDAVHRRGIVHRDLTPRRSTNESICSPSAQAYELYQRANQLSREPT